MRTWLLTRLTGLLAIGWCCTIQAHDQQEILSLSVTNYTGYVIASDSLFAGDAYDRDAIRAVTSVRYTTLGNTVQTYQYQLVFQLLDAAGSPVPLVDQNGQTNLQYVLTDPSVQLPYTVLFLTFKTLTRHYEAPLRPAVLLDPFGQYRVSLSLSKRLGTLGRFTATGVSAQDTLRTYYHFPSLVSNDAPLNVIGTLDTGAYARTYLVNGVPGKDTFTVDTGFTLRRYDAFNAAPATAGITVHLDYELRHATTDALIPLVTNRKTVVKSVASHGIALFGFPLPPTVASFNETLELKPAGQLDSVGAQYKVHVRLSHFESAADPEVPANSVALATRRFLHFNGSLWFGGIETRFSSLANTPLPGVVSADAIATVLNVDAFSGRIVGHPSHTYGNGAPLNVRLRPNGNAEYTGASPVAVNTPAPDREDLHGILFDRLGLNLTSAGARADLRVYLPTGFGYRLDLASRILQSEFLFNDISLTQALTPSSDLVFPNTLYGCEETKPFWIEASSTRWVVAAGRFDLASTGRALYVRTEELDALAAAPVADPALRVKRSNEQYFWFLDQVLSNPVTVAPNPDGAALLSIELALQPGAFRTHFPYDARVRFPGGGSWACKEDLVVPELSRLAGVHPVRLAYTRDCTEPLCGAGQGPDTLELDPTDGELTFTRDGGLTGAGAIVTPKELTWGWIAEPSIQAYAQRVEPFAEGVFHMPGTFLRGDQTPQGILYKPAVLLYTGVGPADPGEVERFGTPAYQDGLGDYGGLNFRVGTDGARQGHSVLAGEPTGWYPLEGRSKYYLRFGGVSGIHEAVFGQFPKTAKLYGYNFTFDNYGLAYRDSRNVDSRTQGSVAVPYPSDFTQNFEKLLFSCLGALEDAQVPAGEAGLLKILEFWQADFSTLAIKFDRQAGAQCDPGQGFLTLGIEAYAQHVDGRLYGTLGFHPTGNLITRADAVLDPPFDSRLKLPNTFQLQGPGSESYTFTPVNDAYYNNWDFYKTEPGFINLAGKLNVPFFEDLKVHLHTSADKDGTSAPIHLMGGWPGKGFEIAGQHFFSANPADPDNRGFPTDATVAAYRQGNTDNNLKYLVRAQRNWLGVVDLDYPLRWSTTTRAFTGFRAVENDLLVLTVKHEAKYLSPDHAELAFGAQYEGLPQINLANLAFDQLSGVANAVNQALGQAARQAMDDGLQRLNEMLQDQMHQFFKPAFDTLLDPVVDTLYDQLRALHLANGGAFPPGEPGNTIASLITGGGNSLANRLKNLVDGATASQVDVLKQLHTSLNQVENALAQVENLLAQAPDGSRQLVAKLLQSLIGDFAAQFAGAFADAQLRPYLDRVDPTLDQIQDVIGDLKSVITQLRSQLASGQQIANELKAKLNALVAEVDAVALKVRNDVNALFATFNPAIDNPFAHYSKAQFRALVRQKIEDRFFASKIATAFQETIKHRLYDVDAAIREGLDTVFQQVNTIIKDVISQSLAEVDKTINGFLGGAADVLGAGRINGYAHINGDALKLLRLDIYAQLKVPSEMEFNAFLQIKELDSDGTPTACLPTSGKATEVTFGATDVELDWISPDLRATAQGKFTFDSAPPVPVLVNLGGGLELTGELSFETLKVKYLGASMAFGTLENYFSCAARIAINKYEGFGGLMFGRACSLDPFFWDKDVQSLLGSPPFTGAYLYAEVWIPISEALLGIPATCLFQISAGVGAGAGFFVEGPTFIGKMLLGAHGDVLCLVSVGGKVKLVGVKNADGLRLKGTGTLTGEIGWCPFCISFDKSIGLEYKSGSWDVDF